MSYPPEYSQTTDFVEYEGNHPTEPYNAPDHNLEFANIEQTLDAVVALLKSLTRSDGKLTNNSVTPEALSTVAMHVVTAGWKPRGNWAAGTDYEVGDLIEGAAAISFVCSEAHTSSSDIAIDRGYGRWVCIGNGVSSAVDDVFNYANQAIAARNAAQAVQSTVLGYVADAESAVDDAQALSNTAGANAVSANASAVAAAASASSANGSAVAAANSAATIDVSNFPLKNGTGATGTWSISISGNAATATTSSTAANGGVTSVNGLTGAVVIQGVPTGAVSYFAMSSAPTGWLKANGALVSRTTYSALFAAIGTVFGVGDGSTTFALPDLRGEFLRGLDDGRGVDTARALGSAQGQDMQPHSHIQYYATTTATGGTGYVSHNYLGGNNTGNTWSTGDAGTTETRPRNVAMLACIKY